MALPDVVVVGGGIVGCACAYYLARGGLRVTLLERGALGSGASKAGMSHVVTWEEPEPHLELARTSQQLYEGLGAELGMEIEYRRTGSLAVVEQPEGLAAMAAMIERLKKWGLACSLLSSEELRYQEPNLAPDLAGAGYFPSDGMVNPLLATRALAQGARSCGAELRTFQEVTGIERAADGRVAAVVAGGERIPAGAVVLAAGAWSESLGRMAGIQIPICPRKGTLVVTAPAPDDLLRTKIVLSAGYMDSVKGGGEGVAVAANIQQVKNGNLLLGSTRQFAGYDTRVEAAVAAQLLERCMRFLPELARFSAIRMWAGLRPCPPDLLPMIGPVGQAPGLYIASGHEGIGITEAPITGKLISEMVLGQQTALAVDPFSPDRFIKS